MSTKEDSVTSIPWNRPIERLRGMDDVLPPAARAMRRATETLSRVAEAHGYQPVDVPLLESTELFLRKSGEALAPKLYAFNLRDREICVRPEFTASIARLFVDQLQDAPLPQRLYYYGPVLRHEKPQRGRRRQFTQWGLELIGAAGPLADAEVLLIACEGLDALGVTNYRVVLGHIGATLEILSHLKLDRRAREFLVANLENLARKDRGPAYVEGKLAELYGHAAGSPFLSSRHLPVRLEREDARALLMTILEPLEADMALGNRPINEVIESVLDRLSRPNPVPLIRQALTLVEQLCARSGVPSQALPAAAALLAEQHLSNEPLQELAEMVSLLQQAGLPEERILVNLGFGRGLHYYTGMIFEIYSNDTEGSEQQLCGGGRYDDLIIAMGGRKKTPACGFAYGVERLLACQPPTTTEMPVDVLVALGGTELAGAALRVARRLRQAGLRVEMDVRRRGARANAQYAARCGIRYVLTVMADGTCRLWDRHTGHTMDVAEDGLNQWLSFRGDEEPNAESSVEQGM